MALTLDDKSEEALEGLVRLSLDAGKPDEALPYLRRYIAAVGDDFDGLLQAADFSLRMKRWDDAFDLASRARDQKFHEKAQRILGLVYLHRGDYAQAVEHLDKADADDEVLQGLIRANLALGALREAAFEAEKASKLDKPGPELTADCERVRRLLQRRVDLARQQPAPAGKDTDWAEALDRVVCAEDSLETGATPGPSDERRSSSRSWPRDWRSGRPTPCGAVRPSAGAVSRPRWPTANGPSNSVRATPAATTSAAWCAWNGPTCRGRCPTWRRRAS